MENSAGAMPNPGQDDPFPSSCHEEAAQTMTFPPQQERVLVVDDEFQVRYLLGVSWSGKAIVFCWPKMVIKP